MTPTALTPAGRGGTQQAHAQDGSSRPPATSRLGPCAPQTSAARWRRRRPRRVSGPAGGATAQRGIAVPAPERTARLAPAAHRPRASSAVGRRASRRLADRAGRRPAPPPRHAAPAARRLVRPCAARPACSTGSFAAAYWIPLLGVLLAGIVAMQVEVLKLNAGIGPLDRARHARSRAATSSCARASPQLVR